jgi:nitrate reductase NapAB chaperone NapD
MRAIYLDFATSRKPSVLGLVMFALALLALLTVWQRHQNINQQLAMLDPSILQLKASKGLQHAEPKLQAKSSADLLAKIEEAKKLASLLMIPWGDVLNALEAAALNDLALLAIEPDAKKRQLKITAEAKNKDILFSYLEKLEASDELTNVYLLKHEIVEDVDQHPIRFVAVATWKDQP